MGELFEAKYEAWCAVVRSRDISGEIYCNKCIIAFSDEFEFYLHKLAIHGPNAHVPQEISHAYPPVIHPHSSIHLYIKDVWCLLGLDFVLLTINEPNANYINSFRVTLGIDHTHASNNGFTFRIPDEMIRDMLTQRSGEIFIFSAECRKLGSVRFVSPHQYGSVLAMCELDIDYNERLKDSEVELYREYPNLIVAYATLGNFSAVLYCVLREIKRSNAVSIADALHVRNLFYLILNSGNREGVNSLIQEASGITGKIFENALGLLVKNEPEYSKRLMSTFREQ